MYEEYFGLKKKPFSIVPDPSFFFMSEGHREGLAHLMYGIQNEGGFVLLTGEVGTGKTTICRRLLELMPEDVEVAFILNPKLTAEELLSTICDEFGIKYPKNTTSIKVLVTLISGYLLEVHEKSRRAVVIIEEAQNLRTEVLEQIRLLTNLETNQKKLLQMIMLGQPELKEILQQPQLRQLSQRITARYHLSPLLRDEVPMYVEYRLSAAGLIRGHLFPPRTLKRLLRLTGGVPRLINVVCDRALLGAYVQGQSRVDLRTLVRAAHEVFGEGKRDRRGWATQRSVVLGLILLVLVIFGVLYYLPTLRSAVDAVGISRSQVSRNAGQKTYQAGVSATAPATTTKSKVGGLGVSTPVPAVVAAGTLERPLQQSGPETREAAYASLFVQWRLSYKPDGKQTVSDQARSQGFECLVGRGGLADLRQMNKPAVLKLVDQRGGKYYATLTALKGETATFHIGSESRLVSLKEIAARWAGEYLVLWRRPIDYRAVLASGATGPMVTWLADRLALASGRPAATDKNHIFDRAMIEQVKQFQLAHGIVPDGIVGPRTIIGLTAAVPNGDPVLYDIKEGT